MSLFCGNGKVFFLLSKDSWCALKLEVLFTPDIFFGCQKNLAIGLASPSLLKSQWLSFQCYKNPHFFGRSILQRMKTI